jgi:hypothetical protein
VESAPLSSLAIRSPTKTTVRSKLDDDKLKFDLIPVQILPFPRAH